MTGKTAIPSNQTQHAPRHRSLVCADDATRLVAAEHSNPHAVLGAHRAEIDGEVGVVVRAWHPEATRAWCMRAGEPPLELLPAWPGGLFEGFIPAATLPLAYRLRFRTDAGAEWECEDPYRFLPTLGDTDLFLFNEGTHRELWRCMGARCLTMDGVPGVAFSVWAPNALRVSVVGEFCGWDGRVYPMRQMGSSGVFEIFLPHVADDALYKYEIKSRTGDLLVKSDPCAPRCEMPPGTASRVFRSRYQWSDDPWMRARPKRDPHREPMSIYEMHFGSWMWRSDGSGPLSYREVAPLLVEHVKKFGFTHVEPMPVAEHPFGGSWGYQVTGYYAPTARYGDPDDFRYFVDYCHQHGIGVILDWVPGHFPKDDFALARFDGTALYEHHDVRLAEHPDWGTLVFNYGRNEVRSFLVSNALYWLNEFHVDGLRVDAVASMLYLDYSRQEGEWVPNKYGGRENLDAISFLQQLNTVVRESAPGCVTIAEESTAWGGVSRPPEEGGLGFTFKWNMGWMHDTLQYFSRDPIHRRFHQGELTFAMVYEYSEHFIMPLSHDEVVHGKRSLLEKMPGDLWQKFANLRTLLAYQYTRPGKQLLFQGTELAPWYEWFHEVGLNWSLSHHPERAGLQRFMQDLGRYYLDTPALWRLDHDPAGFEWIDFHDADNSVLSYCRRDGDACVVIVLNLTPVPRDDYRIGAPRAGRYAVKINSDDEAYHGSGYARSREVDTQPVPQHGRPDSLVLSLPPLAALVLEATT
ncbi:MAG: 1,4-alpha-glucan branching protein GlgB [Planctomycetota bacterium]|nr:MAG: 1,4-alpha-glucan branching protein GlgB [Planctomycetota bacterium]